MSDRRDAERWRKLSRLVAENHMHRGLGGGVILCSAPANEWDAPWASVQAIDHENPRNTLWISEGLTLNDAIDNATDAAPGGETMTTDEMPVLIAGVNDEPLSRGEMLALATLIENDLIAVEAQFSHPEWRYVIGLRRLARSLSSTPTRAATDADKRTALLREAQFWFAVEEAIASLDEDDPTAERYALVALRRTYRALGQCLARESSPSSTTATPDTLHPADEAMLQSYATRQIGEGMPGMVQDASKLARYAIILRMQLSAMSALSSSRALSETEMHNALCVLRDHITLAEPDVLAADLPWLDALLDRLTGAPK